MARQGSMVLAVSAVAVLAVHPDGAVTTDELGELLGANPAVVRRVLGRLRVDGLIEARRGPGGGCALAREPSRIGLGRLHRALRTEVDPARSRLGDALAAAEAAYLAELNRWSVEDVMDRRSAAEFASRWSPADGTLSPTPISNNERYEFGPSEPHRS